MPGHQCYHCKQWVEEGEAHDCWTTTEAALTRDLSEDLQEAYERLRESAMELGEQRVYASHHSIMFARKACYFFVRPKKSFLEVCLFLGRPVKAPQIKRVENPSRAKVANLVHVRHRDEVEAPLTDWLREAYELPDRLAAAGAARRGATEEARRRPQRRPARRRRPRSGRPVARRPDPGRQHARPWPGRKALVVRAADGKRAAPSFNSTVATTAGNVAIRSAALVLG